MNNFIITLGAIVVLVATPSQANWESVGGPVGGIGYDVRIHPNDKNVMYLTDNSAGVGVSKDGGQNWATSNTGLTIKSGATGDAVNIFSLTIDPNTPATLWAGTRGSNGQYGIFKSVDDGVTWVKKDTGIDGTLSGFVNAALIFRGFTVEPGDSNVVYAMAELDTGVWGKTFTKSKGRIFKTIDGGNNWSTIWEGNNLARYLHINPGNTNVLYASTGIFDVEAFDSDCDVPTYGGEGVIKSIDGGASWNNINNGLDDPYIGSLRMHPTNPDILFAAGTANDACQGSTPGIGGLFKTTDGGQNWAQVGVGVIGINVSTVNFAPSNPDIVYAAFENALYRSADGGANWVAYTKPGSAGIGPTGMNMGVPIDLVVDPDDPDTVYVNNYGGGVFKSIDGGVTWNIWTRGMTGANVRDIAVSNDDNSLVYAAARSGIFNSLNYGNDWTGTANGDAISVTETSSVAINPADAQVVLFGADYDATIYRSADAGATVSEVHQHSYNAGGGTNLQKYGVIRFAPSNSSIVYAGVIAKNGVPDGAVIAKSTDGGASFTLLTSPIDGRNIQDILVDKTDANIVYVATSDADPGDNTDAAGLYKSIDGGVIWTAVLANINIGALTQMPNGDLIAGTLWGAAASGIHISIDAGATWGGPYTTGLGVEPYITALAVSADGLTVYAAEGFSGVFSSTDGQTWVSDMAGLEFREVQQLVSNNHALFAATAGGGVYRYLFDQADITPDNFSFATSVDAALSTPIDSATTTISGITSAATIIIVGGEYAINGGSFGSADGLISAGDSLNLRVVSSSQYVTDSSATVTVGDVSRTFTVATLADITPDDFSFATSVDAALSTPISSATATISGITSTAAITIVGGEYAINGGGFGSADGLISAGDSLNLRVVSSSQYVTNSSATVTVGDVSRTFTVTTLAEPAASTSSGGGGALGLYLLALILGALILSSNTVRRMLGYERPT